MSARIELKDNCSSPEGGYLRIWKTTKNGLPELLVSDHNVILDIHRENLAMLMKDDDGVEDSTGDKLSDYVIPFDITLDNQGATTHSDGTEEVFTPSETDRIDDTDPNYFVHEITAKNTGSQPNIVTYTIKIDNSEGNGNTWSRAMMRSINGQPIALKNFESIEVKQSYGLIFDWSIYY